MKILHVIRSSRRESGGPINALLYMARHNAKSGHVYTIASMDAPEEIDISEPNITCLGFGPSLGVYGFNRNFEKWFQENHKNFDAVVVNGVWQHHSKIVHRIRAREHLDYSVFCHGFLDSYFNKASWIKFLKKQIYWLLIEWRVIRDAKYVFFTSEDEKLRSIKSFWPYRGNSKVVSYGSEPPPDFSEDQQRVFYSRHPELREKKFFLFLSRIHPKKGCDLLIRAFGSFLTVFPDYYLVMAGPVDSAYLTSLESIADESKVPKDRIIWAGMLKDSIKWGAFRSASAFVLPSHQENFGVAVSEALSCSLPVLISNQVAIHGQISETNAGIVADDTQKGTEILLKNWGNLQPSEISQMKKNAIGCYDKYFNIAKAAENLIELLK